MKFKKFFLQRVLAWVLTILIGVTFIFFIPRMFPSDPVENMIAQIQSRSGNMDPAEMDALRSSLRVQFGLDGSLLQQYGYFLWHGLLHFDFGPSLMSYPEPVGKIIGRYLPYTLILCLTSTFIAWIVGNLIGLLAGFLICMIGGMSFVTKITVVLCSGGYTGLILGFFGGILYLYRSEPRHLAAATPSQVLPQQLQKDGEPD